jgi:hypothetical protein
MKTEKIHSIPVWLRGRDFSGSFEAAGSSYKFAYAPTACKIENGRLVFLGRAIVVDRGGRAAIRNSIKAVLMAAQSGVGTPSFRIPSRLGEQIAARPSSNLPEVESTGPEAFCGAMYLRLEGLDGRDLGIGADLGGVQLNVRLAPGDAAGRNLHRIYSSLVSVLFGERRNARAAQSLLDELNRALARQL